MQCDMEGKREETSRWAVVMRCVSSAFVQNIPMRQTYGSIRQESGTRKSRHASPAPQKCKGNAVIQ